MIQVIKEMNLLFVKASRRINNKTDVKAENKIEPKVTRQAKFERGKRLDNLPNRQ